MNTPSSVNELVALVKPPLNPKEAGPQNVLDGVEQALGTALPNDIVEFGLHYGSGVFADSIEVYNPFSGSYLSTVRQVSNCYKALKQSEGSSFIPYEVFPTHPGLLVWGSEANGDMMFWLTEGQPAEWPTVLMTVDGQFERHDMSATAFLTKIFKGEMDCILWSQEWINHNLIGLDFHSK